MRGSPLIVLFVGLCMPLRQAFAQGWVEIERQRPETPTGPVSRVGSRVTIAVDDRVARVQVEERFMNRGPTVAEGLSHPTGRDSQSRPPVHSAPH